MSRTTLASLLVAGALSPAVLGAYYVVPDVPTSLDGTTFEPWQVVRVDGAAHALAATLPDGLPVDALHRREDGTWLLSFETPVRLGKLPYDPDDVVAWDGVSFTPFFDGGAAGLPPGTDVDAVALAGTAGTLVVSFAAFTAIPGGPAFEPADLVRVEDWSLVLDAGAATPPIPPSVNLVAADQRGGGWIVSFDVPVGLGTFTALPGDLVRWSRGTFSLESSDPAWARTSVVAGLAFLADPGILGPTLTVAKSVLTQDLLLSWGPGCSVGAEDWGIYEGTLGSWYSHVALDCADAGGNRSEYVPMPKGNRYYLVVPHNPNDEGLYGTASSGDERPRGGSLCRATQAATPCP